TASHPPISRCPLSLILPVPCSRMPRLSLSRQDKGRPLGRTAMPPLTFSTLYFILKCFVQKTFAKRLPACTAARFHARLLRSSPPKTDHPPQISRSKLKRERANASTPSAMSP